MSSALPPSSILDLELDAAAAAAAAASLVAQCVLSGRVSFGWLAAALASILLDELSLLSVTKRRVWWFLPSCKPDQKPF